MPHYRPPIPVYFTSLNIENVRCFGDNQSLDLTENGRPARWTLILGENGGGKTTLLQCLAWMRLVPVGEVESVPLNKDDDSGEPPPLAKGELGPALTDKDNKILESLLRAGSPNNVELGVNLSFGTTLFSAIGETQGITGQGKTIGTGVQIVFDNSRRLSAFDFNHLKIETDFGGEFYEPLVVAYGANRQLGEQNVVTGEVDDPIASRLLGRTVLLDVEELLTKLGYAAATYGSQSPEHKHLDRLRRVLVKVLPGDFKPSDIQILPPDVLDSRKPSGLCFNTFSGLIPMSALSFGYQTTIAWTTDLAWRLLKRYPGSPNPFAEPAVVLVDEIDLHLHPLWQLRIIDDLSEIFPNTQFVATAHSPLMVQIAETANLVLLRQRETYVEIVNDPEVVRSWRVDQILTSELFRIPRARNKQTERLFTRRDELLDKPSRSSAEEDELQNLRIEISRLPTAEDPNDQKAMEFIREAAALLKTHKAVGQ